jgi:peptidoglycan L-alanyl-D-glutamate endopeptidase CwlK
MKFLFLACTFLLLTSFVNAQPGTATPSFDYLEILSDQSLRFDTTRIHTLETMADEAALAAENEWKQWETVENLLFGKDRGSLPMISDLDALHPYFRDRIRELIVACKAQGIELEVVESFRTHAKQAEYFAMGRKYTRSKGGSSKHQYGLAVDLVPIVNSVAVWDDHVLWRRIGIVGERLGLRWGGRWRAPYDPAHFEWTGGVNTYHLASGLQPMIPKSKASEYPCIEEELQQLQKYWDAWEVEQAVMANTKTLSVSSSHGGAGQKP